MTETSKREEAQEIARERKRLVRRIMRRRVPAYIICPSCGAKVGWADRHIHPCATRHLREFKMKNLHHQISLGFGEVRF